MQAVEDSPGGVEQSLGLALALVEQGLLVRFEGFQQLLALGQDVAEELLMVAELAFQFLQLHQQTRQLLVAALGVLGLGQGVGDALAEEFELGTELGHGLARTESLAPLLGARLGLVEVCLLYTSRCV